MTFVSLGQLTVLRDDPSYFGSFTAFNARTFTSVGLTPDQYAFLQTIAEQSIELDAFNAIREVFFPDDANPPALTDAMFASGILERTAARRVRERSSQTRPGRAIGELIHTDSPSQVELCLSRRCNQACFHCNVSARSARQQEKLDTGFWLDVIRQCVAANVLRVTVTGGEPFVREGWSEILAELVRSPIGVIILTNGTRIDDFHIDLMRGRGISLSISLDGGTAKVHDEFRRSPGAFDITVATMARLRAASIPFVVSSVLHAESVDSALQILEIATRVGASRVVFVPIARIGRAATLESQKYFPDNDKLRDALGVLKRRSLETSGPDVILGSADPEYRETVEIQRSFSGATAMSRRNPGLCKAGVYSMAVDEDGLAYSCLRGLQERIAAIGDLKTQSLEEVWNSGSWREFRDPNGAPVPCRIEDWAERYPERVRSGPTWSPLPLHL